jgi:hypothetical protein
VIVALFTDGGEKYFSERFWEEDGAPGDRRVRDAQE